ncbi:hypothetical protein BRC89_05730 [Halobacteriales archaeon QS_4_70_19]|nr:MAG: hypothetical protein BRC89_05730 [Halobacteriales archaeon QS_4_70_19]
MPDGGIPVNGEARAVPEAAELLDRMTDAFFGLDEDWRFTYLNDQARRLVAETTGTTYEPGELEGRHIREVLPESGDGEFFSRYREAVETGEPVTFEAEYEPLGEWFETRAFPSETGLSVYFRDVTGRRRREMRHEHDREALRSLYRIAADAERSFDEKVDDVLELGCTYLDVPYGMMNELDEHGQTVAYARGTPEKLARGTTMPRDEAYCKETIRTDDLLAIVDAVEEGGGGATPHTRSTGWGATSAGASRSTTASTGRSASPARTPVNRRSRPPRRPSSNS